MRLSNRIRDWIALPLEAVIELAVGGMAAGVSMVLTALLIRPFMDQMSHTLIVGLMVLGTMTGSVAGGLVVGGWLAKNRRP